MSAANPEKTCVFAVQTFRDAQCLGSVGYMHLSLEPNTRSVGFVPAGALQLDSSVALKVVTSDMQPFVDGWYTGFVALELDAYLVGAWHRFMVNVRHADCPTVVHFEPSSELIGWEKRLQDRELIQYTYSVAIRPVLAHIVECESEPGALGFQVLDRYGRTWTRVRVDSDVMGWESPAHWYEPRKWDEISREAGPLWPAPLQFEPRPVDEVAE